MYKVHKILLKEIIYMCKKLISSASNFSLWVKSLRGKYVEKDVGGYDRSDWMADLADDAFINEISIPGSHDSCALFEPILYIARCQDRTVTDQLNMGVRYLDIRANVVRGDLVISHGPIFQGISFDSIAEQCYKFLIKNPSETIVFSLKHELLSLDRHGEFAKLFTQKLERHRDMWYTENRIPRLSEVRGKIILLNRVGELNIGIDASQNWTQNGFSSIEHRDFRLNIQDCYKLGSVEEGWKIAKDYFHTLTKESDGKKNLSINFHSGILSLPNVTKVAQHVNAEFIKYAKTQVKHFGIAVFDFITPEICDIIISANS